VGVDLEAQVRPSNWLALSADATLARGRFRDLPAEQNYIPLAPSMTLTANAIVRHAGWGGALRLRTVDDRPANETNTVVAYGYNTFDLAGPYDFGRSEVYFTIENLFDTEWNEAQFDTESRLQNEPGPVDELHFTPGTPFAFRFGVSRRF
jgi:outer membrane receptor protein involved in Fe transport